MRITGSALPLISQHYIGRRTLLIPLPTVNSAISRSAVPPACSSIRRPGAVGPGTLHPSPPRGTEGSNLAPSSSESCANLILPSGSR
jgi:hypothetical protein